MQELRLMGNYIQKLMIENHSTIKDISKYLDISEDVVSKFLQGRLFLTFGQLEEIALFFNVRLEKIFNGDLDYYNKTIVKSNGNSLSENDREFILDVIDDFLTLKEEVNKK